VKACIAVFAAFVSTALASTGVPTALNDGQRSPRRLLAAPVRKLVASLKR
jgi:hypothetical protein